MVASYLMRDRLIDAIVNAVLTALVVTAVLVFPASLAQAKYCGITDFGHAVNQGVWWTLGELGILITHPTIVRRADIYGKALATIILLCALVAAFTPGRMSLRGAITILVVAAALSLAFGGIIWNQTVPGHVACAFR